MLYMPLAIMAIENDDDRAFMESLYLNHRRIMYWSAYKVMNSRQELDDIVEDALIRLIPKISLLRTLECNILRGYVISTVRNTALRHAIRENKRRNVKDPELMLKLTPSTEPEPEASLIREEDVNELMACIERLSDRDRDILRMKYFSNLPDEEIAEILDMKVATVRVCLSRARQRALKMKEELRNHDG